ncbi:MAG: family 16 glycoside hydrolase [Terriglobia bacterium]
MFSISRRDLLASLLVLPAALRGGDDEDTSLFNGHSLDGWKAGEHSHSFRVEDGKIVAAGPRAHLFYTGRAGNANFKNFELKAEVLTRPGACSGLHFHAQFQPHGPLKTGFKVQINNVYAGEGDERDRRKTGSLYGIRDIYKAMVKDDEWFELRVQVRDKQAQVWLNGTQIVDYIEPGQPADSTVPILSHGAFALECCGDVPAVSFRNLVLKPLPDDLHTPADQLPQVDDVYRQLLQMNQAGYPVVDYHTHLKGGLTLEQSLANSRRLGIMYGIAVNGGLKFPITNDAGVLEFLDSMKGTPAFIGLQGEGREWVTLFSRETIAKFDYIFTDCMTFTDDSGVRRRMWIPEEVGEIRDPEQFMDMFVSRILGILNHEPIDIHANPTFLPDVIARDYDRLWTPERMQRVIEAAKANDVAIEINNRYRIPSAAFIQRAKSAGVKFSFGTNNGDPNLGRIEYALEMVKQCGLTWQDIFLPKPEGQKAAQRKGS